MMSRFTEGAKEVMQQASQIMLAGNHTQLDVEHIFLALLQQPEGISLQVISRLGGDAAAMISELNKALENVPTMHGSSAPSSNISLAASSVLKAANDAALLLNDTYIAPEHLLLVIVRTEQVGTVGRLLREAHIDGTKVEAVIRDMRSKAQRQINDAQTTILGQAPTEMPRKHHTDPRLVNPPTLARPVGFSHGILPATGHTLYLAGQTALDSQGNLVAPGDVVGQYRQVLSNLWAVVAAAGGMMDDVVKMTIFVKDRDDYKAHLKELGAVHKEFFGSHYPATALLEVSRFYDDGVLIEIEGIAVIP